MSTQPNSQDIFGAEIQYFRTESGVQLKDRQVIYPSICFTAEGMLVVYSNHMADPDGSFAGQYSHESPDCGGVRCILAYPEVLKP